MTIEAGVFLFFGVVLIFTILLVVYTVISDIIGDERIEIRYDFSKDLIITNRIIRFKLKRLVDLFKSEKRYFVFQRKGTFVGSISGFVYIARVELDDRVDSVRIYTCLGKRREAQLGQFIYDRIKEFVDSSQENLNEGYFQIDSLSIKGENLEKHIPLRSTTGFSWRQLTLERSNRCPMKHLYSIP